MEHGVCNSVTVANEAYSRIEDALKAAYHDASLIRARYENRIRNDLKNIAYQVKYVKSVGVYVYIAYARVGLKFDKLDDSIIEYFKTYPVNLPMKSQEVSNDSSSTVESTTLRDEASQQEDGRSF